MRELHRVTEILKGIPGTAVITDGRFSGASGGLSVGYICPEASEGGPIAFVRDGDNIQVDLKKGILNLAVSEEELARRAAEWVAPMGASGRGVLPRYARGVDSARTGAVLLTED